MSQKKLGVIAAGHQKTAEAGMAMLELGGNAYDAAIAATLASFVVEPTLTSAGGGGFLLAHTKDRRNLLFDFFTQTPLQGSKEIDFYPVELNFGDATQTFHIGMGAVATPGNLAGLATVHQHLGKLPWRELFAPAIDYARRGVEITNYQAFCWHLLEPILLATPAGREIFAPQGKLLQQGDLSRMSDLASSLEAIANQGVELFYRGDIAAQIVADCHKAGGYLTAEDLAQYQVIIRQPLQTHYRGYQLLTNPPPSSGGALIAFSLKLLEAVDLSQVEFNSATHIQILTEVMRLTNQARSDGYDNYIYHPEIAQQFLAQSHLQPYQQLLGQSIDKWGSTTHVSVLDSEGNAASVTTSNGEGSGYIVPGTGIMLNNMLGEADLNPSGFHQWPVNQRLSSMMSPTIILNQHQQPEIVIGSGGSNRIRTAIVQVVSNLIDFNQSVAEAVNHPRIHWENHQLNLEPPLKPSAINQLLLPTSTKLVLWQNINMFFGGVNTVRQSVNQIYTGAGDPRRAGFTLKFN